MTHTHPAIEKLARLICEHGNVTGFKCTCPHPIDGWCGFNAPAKASAAYRSILSEPPSGAMTEAGALVADDDVHAAFAKSTYKAMNRARLRELGLDDGSN